LLRLYASESDVGSWKRHSVLSPLITMIRYLPLLLVLLIIVRGGEFYLNGQWIGRSAGGCR